MTTQEFMELYKGRKVRVKAIWGAGTTGVVSHISNDVYVWILIDGEYTGNKDWWETYRPDELELIDAQG